LVAAIEASKTRPLPSVISGLGILHVGGETAELLARRFGSIQRLMESTEDELQVIAGIGPIVAMSIAQHFANDGNRLIVEELASAGVMLENGFDSFVEGPQPFKGLRFVVTGRLEGLTRSQAESFIKERGGLVNSSVSKKTDYVVIGEEPGSKADDARRLQITMLSENDLRAIAAELEA